MAYIFLSINLVDIMSFKQSFSIIREYPEYVFKPFYSFLFPLVLIILKIVMSLNLTEQIRKNYTTCLV